VKSKIIDWEWNDYEYWEDSRYMFIKLENINCCGSCSVEWSMKGMANKFYEMYEQEIELIIKNNLEKPINIQKRRIEI
jgi:hypothetical protein